MMPPTPGCTCLMVLLLIGLLGGACHAADTGCSPEALKMCAMCLEDPAVGSVYTLEQCCPEECHEDLMSADENAIDVKRAAQNAFWKRPDNSFWKRDGIEDGDEMDEEKRKSKYFLGKRRGSKYFLGKRRLKANFLGKREDDDDASYSVPSFNRRAKYFLGKREPGMPQVYDMEKRARQYFLGKRARQYFLGKRELIDIPEVDEPEKRAKYFLGKRADEITEIDKRAKYFLGKRSAEQPQDAAASE